MRRGLSQFQLGMLVGVSNKADSKWENGSAKPQSHILYKLGEVLGVTVDELLACKYRSTENKNIKEVFAMKKALWKKADEALTGLYGSVPSMEAANRYYSEYAELDNTDQILYFDFLSRMAGLAECSGGHMHINGGIGAPFHISGKHNEEERSILSSLFRQLSLLHRNPKFTEQTLFSSLKVDLKVGIIGLRVTCLW